jgi:putative hydrolase of the HAD superfamily
MKNLKVIAFDADDTLFINEPYFEEAEEKFCALMNTFASKEIISKALYTNQISNLDLYGYGIKGYILSMVETAIKISDNRIKANEIDKILSFGKELLQKPIVLID